MSAPAIRDSSSWVMGPEARARKIKDFYKFGKRLGQPGQFGYAVECVSKETGDKYACKAIKKSKFNLLAQRKAFFGQLRDEINIMRDLDHKNIIKFFDVYEDETNVYIIMEHCAGGELFDRISQKGSYSEADASKVLRQVVMALEYLHANDIAHCDLKPDNFLFVTSQEDSPLKIIDFGMSKIVKFRKYFRKFCGTPYYVAPEVIDGSYTEACDMWSVGVVMFVMLFGYPPFYVDPQEYHADNKILGKVKKGFDARTRPNYGAWFPAAIKASDSAKDLIEKLLNSNHVDRYTAKEALAHPWLKGDTASTTAMDGTVLAGLKQFRQTCKFKAAVLSVMVDHLGDDQLDKLKEEFRRLDVNGDGEISQQELKEALEASEDSSLAESDIATIFAELDVNNDGAVSYDEMCMAAVNQKLLLKEERLWKAFQEIDENGDGHISPEELQKAAKLHGVDVAQELIAEVDVNGDGHVDYHEFLQLFTGNDDDDIPTVHRPSAA